MQRFSLLFFLIFFTMILSGCDALYKKEYNYIPPKANMEKRCANACYVGKNSCEKICYLKNQACFMRAYDNAKYDYQNYVNQMHQAGKRVTKDIRDFADTDSCSKNCHCVTSFNTCYSACGGQVIERM